jgi:hypothetical protein
MLGHPDQLEVDLQRRRADEPGELVSVWIFFGIRFRSPMRSGRMSCRARASSDITMTPSRDSTSKAGSVSGRVMGIRLDWLCAKGRQSYLAVTPFAGAGPLVLDVDGRVQSFEVLVQNGTAYAPVSVTAPIFAHVASGAGFAVLDTAGRPVARFSMEGAPGAIGQAEGRCRV